MLRLLSHAAHLIVEAVLGVMMVAALATCVLAWRLAQGPIDVTGLVRREQARFPTPATDVSIGAAALAWEGFGATDQPLDLRVRDVRLIDVAGGSQTTIDRVRVSMQLVPLLTGRLRPRSAVIEGAKVELSHVPQAALGPAEKSKAGASDTAKPAPARQSRPVTLPVWLLHLQRLRIANVAVVLHDAERGIDWQASKVALTVERLPTGGLSGNAHMDLSLGSVTTTLDAQSVWRPDGTHLTIGATPVSPSRIAGVLPQLAGLAAIDLPVGLQLEATLDAALMPQQAHLVLAGGAGRIAAGRGGVNVDAASASMTLHRSDWRLDTFRVALARSPQGTGPAPVITGTAGATMPQSGGPDIIHANFGIDIDSLQLSELGLYWPPGTGGGARGWLTQNLTAGHAQDVHVSGTLDAQKDLSDVQLTALSGGFAADDVTLYWLRPIPPVVHGRARLTIEGPDSLRIAMDSAEQDHLHLGPGSGIRITGLLARDQFGDIVANMSGPLADALHLLNHPRLQLLSRSNIDIVDPAGTVQARLTLHVPLEDRVTIDDIPIAASATLSGVRLGRVVAGRDLTDGELSLKVNADGLKIGGTGAVSGIPADMALDMDFRAGPPAQVVQHLTASGHATPAQLAKAGLPPDAVGVVTGGAVKLRVDYQGRRNDTADLQVDADLGQAALAVPLGWSKPAGPPAAASGRILLDHGRVAGVDGLHAEGPNLAIVSRASIAANGARTLQLDQLDIGRTRARGEIGFPAGPADPVHVQLSGAMLDLSSYLDAPDKPPGAENKTAAPSPDEDDKDEKPGTPWAAKLNFTSVQLARGRELSPMSVDAASDGSHILHAAVSAGAPGQLAVSIVPESGGRRMSIVAADAGMMLRALDVADNLQGGTLRLDGTFADDKPGAPLTGTATLTGFNLRDAPAIGRLLQVMTLYGVADTLHGPGLHFSRMVAPFRWQKRVLHLTSARAFSPSLGITADGDLDLRRHTADMRGTVVPAYFFNQLLGDLPLIGRIFSPEKGGGVFAARYSVRGPLANPKVGVNPLSALTPGFLREVFGIFGRGAAKTE